MITSTSNDTTAFHITGKFHNFPMWTQILVYMLSSAGTIGNSCVLLVIYKSKFLHTKTNYLIANLAFIDLLVCIFFILQFIYDQYGNWPSTQTGKTLYCGLIFSWYITWTACVVTAQALFLVSVERFIGIVYPLHYHRYITTRRLQYGIAVQWCIAIIVQSHCFLAFSVYIEDNNSCGPHPGLNTFTLFLSFIPQIIACYLYPVISLAYCYIRMFSSLKHNDTLAGGSMYVTNIRQARKNVIQNLFIVTILFVVCLTPCQSATLTFDYFHVTIPNETVHEFVYNWSKYVMVVLNSVANPFIYALRYKLFRKGLFKLVK